MIISVNKHNIEFENFISFLMAFYIEIPIINQILIAFSGSLSIMTQFYMLCIVVFFVFGMLEIVKTTVKVDIPVLLVFLLLTVYYCFTTLIQRDSTLTINNYIVYTLVPLVLPILFKINSTVFIKSMMIIPCLGIVKLNSIFIIDSNSYISMGLSYAILAPVLASLVFLVTLYRAQKHKVFYTLVLLINFVYLVEMVVYGSRGTVLSVLLCIITMWLFKYDCENNRVTIRGKRTLLLSLAASVIILNGQNILFGVNNFFVKRGITVQALEKSIRLLRENSLFNGRNSILEIAFDEIMKKPFVGHGMSTFEYYTGINYPHNFLVQFLFDGGLLLFGIIVIVFLVRTIKVFKHLSKNQYFLYVYLFFLAVPGALFSGDIWENSKFWFLMGWILTLCSVKEKKNNQYEK